MATLLKQTDLGALLSFTEVSVLQTIDAAALKVLLSQLLTGQAAATDRIKAQQQEIDALKTLYQELQQQQKDAARHLGSAAAGSTCTAVAPATAGAGVPASAHPEPDGPAQVLGMLQDKQTTDSNPMQARLRELDNRLTRLEGQQHAFSGPAMAATPPAAQPPQISDAPAESDPGNRSSTVEPTPAPAGPGIASSSVASFAFTSAAAPLSSIAPQAVSATDHSASIADLQHQHALLASQLAALQAALAAADAKSTLLAGQLESKAEEGQVQVLGESLKAKADGRELELIRKQLAGKADKSELDALLNGLAAVSTTDASEGTDSAGGSGLGSEAGGDGAGSAQVNKLQLQLALLQERIANKADITAVANVSVRLDATRQDTIQLQVNTQDLANQLAAARKAIADVQNSLHSSQQDVSQIPSTTSQDIILQMQQLPLMLLRLSALEEALTTAATATGNVNSSAATVKPSTSTNGRFAVQNGSSMHVRAACNPIADDCNSSNGSAINDLADNVVRLQLQVKQLMQMVRSSSNKQRAASAADPSGAQAAAGAAGTGTDIYTPADSTDEAAGCCTEAEAVGNTASGFAELTVRAAELQEQLVDLAAAKADRGELEKLRSLLAETASQSDTESLRHKLDSQQSQLTRLAHQLSLAGARPTSGSNTSHTGSAAPAGQSKSGSFKSLQTTLPGSQAVREVSLYGALAAAGGQAAHSDGAVQLAVLDGPAAEQPALAELQEQLEQQLAGFETLAEAVCLLAAGQAAVTAAGSDTSAAEPSDMKSNSLMDSTAAAAVVSASRKALVSAQGARTGSLGTADQGFGPQLARLRRLIKTGHVGRKLDWFDPVLLQKMAQRLAATEALIKMHLSSSQASAGGIDADGRLKRLAADVKMLKEQMGSATAAGAATRQSGQGGWGIRDGDHAMLASKPLAGYRCMACDRPLASLDSGPGPYLPIGGMPMTVSAGVELEAAGGAALGKLAPASSRRNTVQEAVAASTAACNMPCYSPASSPEPLAGVVPARRVTGPQSWYASTHGLPAEQLPKGDVGPHLPPGGWRGSLPRAEDGSVLPALVSRGGGAAGTQGASGGR